MMLSRRHVHSFLLVAAFAPTSAHAGSPRLSDLLPLMLFAGAWQAVQILGPGLVIVLLLRERFAYAKGLLYGGPLLLAAALLLISLVRGTSAFGLSMFALFPAEAVG